MKKLILTLVITFLVFLPGASYAKSLVDTKTIPCITNGDCKPCDLIKVFLNAADILVGLSGTFGIIMVIYGGFVMVTAYGSSSRVTWGKNTIVAAVTGIILVMLAWTLVNLIMEGFFGVGSQSFSLVTGKSLAEWNVCK